MAWRSSGTTNDEMVNNLKRKSKKHRPEFVTDALAEFVPFSFDTHTRTDLDSLHSLR